MRVGEHQQKRGWLRGVGGGWRCRGTWRVPGHSHSITAALYAELNTALEALSRVREVPEVLIVPSKSEPCRRISAATCGLKIAERIAWIFAKEIGVGARAGQGCSEVDGFCDVRGHRAGYRLRVRNLNNSLDSDLGEASQSGIGNAHRTRSGIGRRGGRLDTVDEEQNVPCPSNLEGRVVIGLLYKGKRRREIRHGGERGG
jgi:hypothetical protein